MRGTLRYVLQQALWLLTTGLQLIGAMGLGFKWMLMTWRCVTFAMLDLLYFIPQVLWYLLSPTIIRRVSYRSSRKTKIRNLEKLLRRRPGTQPPSPQVRSPSLGAGGSSGESPHSPSATAAVAGGEGNGLLDALLAARINPADGSFAAGLPVDLTAELSACNASIPQANNSFDETVAALQRLQERRLERERAAKGISQPRSPGLRAEDSIEASLAERVGGGGGVDNASLTSLDDTDEEEDEEDVRNMHNRAFLDIYLPVPLDSLFRFLSQEQHGTRSSRSRMQRKKFPVLICVNGGAWVVGSNMWNCFVARVFAARGYVVFSPDYRNFPQGTMEDMILDVSDAIGWVLSNAERYNGDLDNVTLMGQSAGAHLTMMSLLSQAHLRAYEHNKEQSPDATDATLPPPTAVAYNVPRYDPRKCIHQYVGLSGIYDVHHIVRHLDRRGLYRSVLYQIAGGHHRLARYTVNNYFDPRLRQRTGESVPDNIVDFLPAKMFFLHGDADCSAPVQESANLVHAMRAAQREYLVRAYRDDPTRARTGAAPSVIEFVLIPGATHTDAIIEEPLACRNSHVVEFLTCYTVDTQRRREALDPAHRHARGASLDTAAPAASTALATVKGAGAGGGAVTNAAAATAESGGGGGGGPDDEDDYNTPVKRPDGVLLSPLPSQQRPVLMRIASYICPF